MNPPLHVAIVVHSLNHNNVGRVYPFLKAFVGSPAVRYTLVGWDTTGTLFPLLHDLPWSVVRLHGSYSGAQASDALAHATADCAIIHCFKNRAHLRSARAICEERRIPLVLDLDDWELGLYLEGVSRWPLWRKLLSGLPVSQRIQDALELEQLARTAPDCLIVNSRALQGYFGGEILYTAADATEFAPDSVDRTVFRRQYALPEDAPLIGFLGTPHPHKGIDDLLQAFSSVQRSYPNAQLLFVGVQPHNPYHRQLANTSGVKIIDYIYADQYPAAYAACDIIAIPQRAVIEGIVQTPAKLILAMAAGRPIVATSVGDIPTILGDTGVLVSPQRPALLASAIKALLANPQRQAELGAAARERFLSSLTLEHLQSRMLAIYQQAMRGGQPCA